MTAFEVDVRRQDGNLVIVPSGELDIATVDHVRGALEDRATGEDVEIDLRNLSFLDTSGLQLVVETHRRSREDGYELRIVRGSTNVQRVFEIAGLERVLPFTDPDGPA
jgi:anti-sigma B factor antagonist